jgi:GNAT superfamily N-acetyltransferase
VSELRYLPYGTLQRQACLQLFDANCPAFFAPNERADFAAFLDQPAPPYIVVARESAVIAAFGVRPGDSRGRARLTWIMVDPAHHGSGVGRCLMREASRRAAMLDATVVDIAASHLSAPFFARFGAREQSRTENGWGPGMHRIDMEWPVASSGGEA